jgi:hypothetical protein
MKNPKPKTKTKFYLHVRATAYTDELIIGFAHTRVEARNKLEAYRVGHHSLPLEERDDIVAHNDYVVRLREPRPANYPQ